MKKTWKYAYNILFWVYIVFFIAMSFDIDIKDNFWRGVGGFLIHNIPTVILLVAHFATIKNYKVRSILFLILAIASVIFFRTYINLAVFLYVTVPILALSGFSYIQSKTIINPNN
ncbi:hypothetical protein JW962_03010 [Candidatus Dojkabacteria bacterium]|nr:hypothetical protein [Candidatus Dojkabacteria bacterium]